MVSLEEIEKTIMDLEKKDTTFAVCERLAWLYIVRDHMASEMHPYKAENTAKQAPYVSGTDFLNAIAGKPLDAVFEIVGEHMETIRLVYPKEYDAIIKRIEEA